jgi:CubicO group peptidase (beta-lactamase class C family)
MQIKNMKTYLVFTIIILLLNIGLISSVFANTSSNNNSENIIQSVLNNDLFDLKIRSLMFAGYIPSLTACIIDKDEVIWSNGYGFYDFKGFKKPSSETIYQVASVSKTVTATAILQLYEQELFNLDDDVNLYLPFSLRNPNFPDVPITFRFLLSHHSSLHDHDETIAYEYFAGEYPLSYVEELLSPDGEAYHQELWGDYPPGNGGNYSNMGFTILGYLVELLSGQLFEDYCQENIFIPLEMTSTSFEMDKLPIENFACDYFRFGRLYVKSTLVDYTFIDPCGGLLTNIDDLANFLIAHMNHGMYNNVRILNEETIDEMHRVQYPNSAPYYGTLRFGLGWLIIEEEFGVATHGHNGDLTFSHARMRVLNDNSTGIIYLFNKGVRPSILPRTIPNFIERQFERFIRGSLYNKALYSISIREML